MPFLRVWEATGRAIDSNPSPVAVIAVGSVERHGDHLPLGTDTMVAHWVAERVAEELGAHLYPPIWFGSSKGLSSFRGTIDVDDLALASYVEAVLREIARSGYRICVVVNGHGGNSSIVRVVARRVAFSTGMAIAVVDWWRDVAQEARKKLFEAPGHAGEDETSAVLCIREDLVDMEAASSHSPRYIPRIAAYSPAIDSEIYPRALLGDATKASKEKGCRWLEAIVSDIVESVRELARNLGIEI
ncbi:MAG: creatininase family protein [Crenarchaeota archaeon]|nr:creatininase family protein [Thermoproteota archaeon]